MLQAVFGFLWLFQCDFNYNAKAKCYLDRIYCGFDTGDYCFEHGSKVGRNYRGFVGVPYRDDSSIFLLFCYVYQSCSAMRKILWQEKRVLKANLCVIKYNETDFKLINR